MLVGLIASNYHRLAIGKRLLNEELATRFLKAFRCRLSNENSFITTLQKSSAEKITKGIQLIADADLAIKTSQATPRLQLEMLVCELAS